MSSVNRVELHPACVLHRKPYRDTSLLLELFTRDHGRIGVVAKGARRRQALSVLLQPFSPLMASWSGRGELKTLIDAERGISWPSLSGVALISAFYLNELLMRLLHRDDPHPELYNAYVDTLTMLAAGDEAEWLLRLFERELLEAIGYGLLLTHEADSGEAIQPERRYCYHLEQGPVVTAGNNGLVISGHGLLALASGEKPDACGMAECKRLMRAALGLYLGNKPLESRKLFRQQHGHRSMNTEHD